MTGTAPTSPHGMVAMAEHTIREYEDVSQVDDTELRHLLMRASAYRAEYRDLGENDLAERASDIIDRFLDELSARMAARETGP